MKTILPVTLFFALLPFQVLAQVGNRLELFFLKDTIRLNYQSRDFVDFSAPLSDSSIYTFYLRAERNGLVQIGSTLKTYKQKQELDDWFYYQVIRKAAQAISPKAANYNRYTLYKWFLLKASGYDAILTIRSDKVLLYVRSNENVYNIPYRVMDGRKYICLNYHDYGQIDFEKEKFVQVLPGLPTGQEVFSYNVTHVPDLNENDYREKEIQFTYQQQHYQFKIKLSPEVKNIFTNYPVIDYEKHFNMPLSKRTHESLIGTLKVNTEKMKQKEGIEFLLHFTRSAFSFKNDQEVYGGEKRLTPEQTLLYDYSDCEDRAALFFFLIKEIYNLPMLVLAYPEHVTIAVQLEKPYGKTIEYKGKQYSVCEPSPQKMDLRIGQLPPGLDDKSFEIAYAFQPLN